MKIFKLTSYFALFLSLSFLFQGCSEDSPSESSLNFVTFEAKTKNIAVSDGATSPFEVKVFTTQVSGSDRTFGVTVGAASSMDPAYFVIPATVTVPANSNVGILTVNVTGVGLDLSAAKTIVLNLVEQADIFSGKSITLNVRENCTLNTVTLDLVLDRYGDETTWKIVDADNNLIASGGPYGTGANNNLQANKNFIFCLPSGDYTFSIYDSEDDGMTWANVLGTYVVKSNGVALFNGLGDFGPSRSHNFTLN